MIGDLVGAVLAHGRQRNTQRRGRRGIDTVKARARRTGSGLCGQTQFYRIVIF